MPVAEFVTVTMQDAVTSPSSQYAMIVVVPAFIALTLPFSSTVATLGFVETQVTVLSNAASGMTVA